MTEPLRAASAATSEAPDEAPAEAQALAARVLALYLGGLGALVTLVSLAERAFDGAASVANNRLGFGVLLLAGAVLCGGLLRIGRRRFAAALLLMVAMGAASIYAWTSGLGTYALALAGVAVLIAVSGAAAGMQVATGLALLYACVVGLQAWAETEGMLGGPAAAAKVTLRYRVIGHLLLGLGGWMAAWLLYRVVGGALRRAVTEGRRLADLLRIGSDWTWEMDAQARLTALSASFEARAGHSVAEFMRLGEDGGPRVVADAEWEALRDDLRALRPYRDRVITFLATDGTLLHVRGTGEPVFDAQGRLTGWRGVGCNVTAERQAQQQRRRTEAMLDRLVRMSPDAICVARLNSGRILLANAAFAELAGRSEAEVLGRTALELGLWRDAGDAARLRDALQPAGMVRDMGITVHFQGDRPREMLMTAAAFDWDDEQVAVITTRDVTEIVRARIEGDAILDNAGVGIAFVREGRFERVNPQWEAMFGHARGTLAGRRAELAFADTGLRPAAAAAAGGSPVQGRPIDIEREVARADGSRVVLQLRARPVDAARPREAGTIWVAEDITERRRGERELSLAKQQAEAANEAKSAFLATMSHEIRTPLSGVLGLARLLQDPALDAVKSGEFVRHLVEAAEQLSGIVSDVLDLSKIESGQLELEEIAFDLHDLADSTFRTFAPLGRERGLEMACRIDPSLPTLVRGDPVRVRQVLANYFSNALKFTARGQVLLTVDPGREGRVRLAVHDSGMGVSAELRGRLFRPFEQADSSTTRRYGGSGLGLAICRQLAQRMGGEVGVDSDGRSGSCFWVELRLPAAALDGGALVPAPAPAPAQALSGLRVLVAEDNAVNMLIVGTMLRHLGADVLQANDGEEAVALAQEHADSLHAVLMDLHMPVTDGLAATRLLRADPRTARLPVFALSAAVLERDRQDAAAAGMDGFVAKPAGPADLMRVLRPLVQG